MGFFKYVMITSILLTIATSQVNTETLEESIKLLKQAKTIRNFTDKLKKINFQNIFKNETIKTLLSPRYSERYLEVMEKQNNIWEIINTENLMTQIRSKQNLTEENFLKMVLKNIDALKAVNLVDWSTFVMQSNGGKGCFENSVPFFVLYLEQNIWPPKIYFRASRTIGWRISVVFKS